MRRALLVLLALPASALAQSAGTINLPSGFQRINIAQCTGTQNAIIGNDDLNATLTWTLNPGSNAFVAGQGTVSLYAANEQPNAGQGTNFSCTAPNNTGSTTFKSAKVANTDGVMDITPTGLTMTQTFAWKNIVAATTLGCTGAATNTWFASPLASKWGTLYLPLRVGMRASASGTHRRVSSSVDQMTCPSPACFAAAAMFFASASSLSGEKWSQKNVTQKAP